MKNARQILINFLNNPDKEGKTINIIEFYLNLKQMLGQKKVQIK